MNLMAKARKKLAHPAIDQSRSKPRSEGDSRDVKGFNCIAHFPYITSD